MKALSLALWGADDMEVIDGQSATVLRPTIVPMYAARRLHPLLSCIRADADRNGESRSVETGKERAIMSG
jgi:hypothetical protein